MQTLSRTRIDLNKSMVAASKEKILSAALRLASQPGGWSALTRDAVARAADCSEGLPSKYFGTMPSFRRAVMRAAISRAQTSTVPRDMFFSIIAQGVACGDKCALKAPAELKADALKTLAKA